MAINSARRVGSKDSSDGLILKGWFDEDLISSDAAATTVYVNVAGVWKYSVVYVNVAGVWKLATTYVNVGGVWK